MNVRGRASGDRERAPSPEGSAQAGPDRDPEGGANLPGDPSIRKILVLKWSAMGDVALASAAIEDLAHAFPGREVHLNTLPPWERLFAHDPRLARVTSFDLRRTGADLRGMWRWVGAVRGEGYDLIVDLQSTDRSRILMTLLWLTGRAPPYRLGNHRRFPYNLAPAPPPPPIHALERLRVTLRAGGIPTRTPRPVLHPAPGHRARARDLLAAHGLQAGGYAVFLPGSQAAGYLKRWGVRRYVTLALRLRELGVPRVVLLGGGDEIEECRAIQAGAGASVVNLCDRTALLELVPIAEGARFAVANDTGTAHVVAAAGRPMVVVCGPTDPRRVKPAGEAVAALQAPLYCVNCYRKHCTHHSCMLLVSPEQVVEALQGLSALPA